MSNEEKLRLLFVEQEEFKQGHAARASQGAATILGRWPSYLASAAWCIIFAISFATLLMLIIFMALLNEGKIGEKTVFYKKGEEYSMAKEIKSEFCSQMIARRHGKRRDIPEQDLQLFDSGENIFYMVMNPMDKFSSCSVESVIQHCPSKNIFMMFLKNVDGHTFENELKNNYSNFNLFNAKGNKLLQGSPFEGKWKGDNRSLFEVALLTVWQFGGTVLSENLLMLNNKILESHNIDCKVYPDFIFCPEQCAAYLYDLIGVTLKSKRNTSKEFLLDESVKEFCGSEHLMKTGCTGVYRLTDDDICEEDDDYCMLIRTKEWLANRNETSLLAPLL